MNKYFIIIVLSMIMFFGCKKETEEIKDYSLSGRLNIIDKQFLSDNQEIRIGIFDYQNQQLIKSIKLPTLQGKIADFRLMDIPEAEYEVKIFVWERSVNKYSMIDYGNILINKNIVLPEKELKLITFLRVQKQIFNSCIQCHGASSGAVAAGLDLMEGKSFQNIVNVKSYKSELLRIKPFYPDSSFIMNVLKRQNINFDHSGSLTASEGDYELMENWILLGAKNN